MTPLNVSVKLPSGAELILKDAPFENAMALFEVVSAELGRAVKTGISVPIGNDPKAILGAILGQDIPLDALKDALAVALSSKTVKAELWPCMERCTYAGVGITRATFEPRAARGDFLVVAWEVAKFNLDPFVEGIRLKLSIPSAQT